MRNRCSRYAQSRSTTKCDLLLQRKKSCLRGMSEQEELRFNQIHLLRKPFSIQYCEHGSNNNQGGVQEQSPTVKSVTINVVPGSHRCHVYM